MNSDLLRQSLKAKWLEYYRDNRPWLTRLAVWVECDGQRRPSSGFILAALSALEPRLADLLPLVVDLNNNPDRIVVALGLNFNPDEAVDAEMADSSRKLLLEGKNALAQANSSQARPKASSIDEACQGVGRDKEER